MHRIFKRGCLAWAYRVCSDLF